MRQIRNTEATINTAQVFLPSAQSPQKKQTILLSVDQDENVQDDQPQYNHPRKILITALPRNLSS